MNEPLQLHELLCPYCGESITVLVDCTVAEQSYIEDCEVCCQPILFHIQVGEDGAAQLTAAHENQ